MIVFDKVDSPEKISEVETMACVIWNQHFVPMVGQALVDYMLGKYQSAEAIAGQIHEGVDYYILRRGGEPSGYLALRAEPERERMMISKIYVIKDIRGTGAGSLALDFAVRRAKEQRLSTLWLYVNRHNESSLTWYRQKGFRAVREVRQDIGHGFFTDDFMMELTVSDEGDAGIHDPS